jgi:XTP/dITP diphosphohydrolase
MSSLIFVTGNKFKFKFAKNELEKFGIKVRRKYVKIREIQADSLEEIVEEKAKEAYKKIRKPLVVTDSGLFIKSLNGFPGPYSSYVEKTIGINGIINLVKRKKREAYVKTIVCFNDGKKIKTFASESQGRIITHKKGKNGFFFDFIFVPKGEKKTLAEMSLEKKIKIWVYAWDAFAKWYLKKYKS